MMEVTEGLSDWVSIDHLLVQRMADYYGSPTSLEISLDILRKFTYVLPRRSRAFTAAGDWRDFPELRPEYA